jgi:hypothetical protein
MATLWRWPLTPQASAAGVAVTAAAPTGSGISPLPQLPAFVYQPGCHLFLRATGEVTSTSATPTVVLGFYFGATGSAIGSKAQSFVTAALAINVAATAWPFILEFDGTVRAVSGSAGAVHGQGICYQGFGAAGGLSAALVPLPFPVTAAARSVATFNSMQNLEIDVGVTLSSVTGTPSVTVTDLWCDASG